MESNKLIAEFMGATLVDWLSEVDPTYNLKENSCIYRISEMQYHASWDWLMPVVEKIEQDKSIAFGLVRNGAKFLKDGNVIADSVCDTKIDAVYYAVIQFIEWYNTTHPLTQ